MNRRRLTRLIFLVLLMAILPMRGALAADRVELKSGDVAPDLVGKTFKGDTVQISSYKGKVVVVSFWATWCPYCLKELPVLESIQRVGGLNRVKVIAVNNEGRETFRTAQGQMRGMALTLANDPEQKVCKTYGVDGIPHMVIIGRDGRIIRVYRGYDESALPTIVQDLNNAINEPVEAASVE